MVMDRIQRFRMEKETSKVRVGGTAAGNDECWRQFF